MKNILTFIIAILFTHNSFSQINDCSKCDSKIYTSQDISHLSLLELKIIRNEIFARHQYIFKDSRLSDYFLENYTWYKPDYNTENNIKLNSIEKQNISLFSTYEKKKEAIKTNIIEKLKDLKSAILINDTIYINSVINKVANNNQKEYANGIKTELKDILSVINIDGINWYNEKGLYKVTTDDGHFIKELAIEIQGDTMTLSYAYKGFSELLNDDTAFKFGSNFDSTNEYVSWYTFIITDHKLSLKEHQAAG